MRFWHRLLRASPAQIELHFVNQNLPVAAMLHCTIIVAVLPKKQILHHCNFMEITVLTSVNQKDICLLNASSQKGHNRICTSAEKGDWDYKGIVQLFLISS